MMDAALKQAEALLDQGDRLAARGVLANAVARSPDNVQALHLLSTIDIDEGHFRNAQQKVERVLELDPQHVAATYNLGVCLMQQGISTRALEEFRKALGKNPDHAGARFNAAFILRMMGHLNEAASHFARLVKIAPDWMLAWEQHCEMLFVQLRFEDVLSASEGLVRQQKANADIFRIRADALRKLGRLPEAEASYHTSLRMDSTDPDAWQNLAGTLQLMGRGSETVPVYERVLSMARHDIRIANRIDPALTELIRVCRRHVKWAQLGAYEDQAINRMRNESAAIEPLLSLMITEDPKCHLSAARGAWPSSLSPPAVSITRITPSPTAKFRIGYISGDFREHPSAHLLSRVLELHDKTGFETFGYSVGPDDASPCRERIGRAFSTFKDVHSLNDEAIATIIARDQLDLLVDVTGHTEQSRLGVMRLRPAPVSAHYLAFPGSLGTRLIDYLIADHQIVPAGDDAFFDEAIVRLPDTYQSNDNTRPIPTTAKTRADYGLEQQAFVFCAFMQTLKLGPALFDVYMDILRDTPASVLWLLEERQGVSATLRNEAASRGIDPRRLVFADRVENREHMGRQTLADLMLDSWPYGGHTTTSDALWAGVPVLTRRGSSFASRVASSLLLAAGMPELIAPDVAGFKALTIRLVSEPATLAGLRKRLEANRMSCPLFDSQRFTTHLEQAFTTIIDRNRRGLAPESFSVPSMP
ncbi:MAG: tetratricopeptide repeat protein [Alphaproteobacteria bacterium]|nr:tetratricopeptide repeat protein [Alphaproteobacteria bacterium]